MDWNKRAFLAGAGTLGAALAAGGPASAQARPERTLPMNLGPFYPVVKPVEDDADLTRITGHSGRAKGQVIELGGRVLGRDGKPVGGARIEIWQANAAGRYAHKGDTHGAPLDPDFQGYAVATTDTDGRYRFLTVKPGAYPGGGGVRSPHIHFDVSGHDTRLVTQMYFPGEPELKQDRVLAADLVSNGADMSAPIFGALRPGASTAEAGATLCTFDVVLGFG